MKTTEEQNRVSDEDKEKVAVWRMVSDSYKFLFPMRAWLLEKVLKHMRGKFGLNATIFYLTQELQKIITGEQQREAEQEKQS